MRIKSIESRSRRDFTAIYECEKCGVTKRGSGYDDRYFHETVIPNMACAECGHVSGVQTSHHVIPEGVTL